MSDDRPGKLAELDAKIKEHWQQGPANVNSALWQEFREIGDRVYELHHKRVGLYNDDELSQPTRRIVFDIPEEWFLLFAWLEKRAQSWRRGDDQPTGLTLERMARPELQKMLRNAVAGRLFEAMEQCFQDELGELTEGTHVLLRPRSPQPTD